MPYDKKGLKLPFQNTHTLSLSLSVFLIQKIISGLLVNNFIIIYKT